MSVTTTQRDDDKGDVVTAPIARSPRSAPRTARDATTRRRGDGDPHYSQAQKPPGPRFMTLGSRSMSSASSIFRSCSTPHQRHAHDQPQTWRTVIIGRKKPPTTTTTTTSVPRGGNKEDARARSSNRRWMRRRPSRACSRGGAWLGRGGAGARERRPRFVGRAARRERPPVVVIGTGRGAERRGPAREALGARARGVVLPRSWWSRTAAPS